MKKIYVIYEKNLALNPHLKSLNAAIDLIAYAYY